MPPENSPSPRGGPFTERLQRLESPYLDPAFTLWKVRDLGTGEELYLQYFPLPPSGWPADLTLQWEALQACRDSLWLRPQEKLVTEGFGGLVYWVPPGRAFNGIRGTLRDEVYLQWLQDALHDLHQLHRRGILHLAQNPRSWIVFQSDEAMGRETMGLSDISLHLELPLGQGMNAQTAVALAPEILRGEKVDVRADLYGLGVLLLLQRSPHLFHHLKTFQDWIKIHLDGSLVSWIPERTTPLNEILRQLLQPDPNQRPASVADLLKTMDPQNPLAHMTSRKFHDWSARRVKWRQVTLIGNTLYSLLELGESDLAETMLKNLEGFWQPELEAYPLFFQSRLAQLRGDEAGGREFRNRARERGRQDPKLLALLDLEEAQEVSQKEVTGQVLAHLQKAWAAASQTQDNSLKVKILLERGRAHKASGEDAQAIKELKLAYDMLPQVDLPEARSAVLGELADELQAYGFFRQAGPLLDMALEFSEPDPAQRSRRLLQGALGAVFRGDGEKSREYFREARHLISAQKDMRRLVWAMAHEVRLSIAQENWEQVRRELKAVRVRNREHGFHEALLNLLELQLVLATQRGLSVHPEKLYAGLEELVVLVREGKSFQDLSWPPAQTALYLEAYLKWRGRLGEAREMKKIYEQAWDRGRGACLALGFSEEVPVSPKREWVAVQGKKEAVGEESLEAAAPETKSTEAAMAEPMRRRQEHYLQEQIHHLEATKTQLLKENFHLNQEIQDLREQLERVIHARPTPAPRPPRSQPKPKPKPKARAKPERIPEIPAVASAEIIETPPSPREGHADSGDERAQLIAALKRHQGHRSRAARDLGIHRRTILERIKRHGLENMDFLPSAEEMQAALTNAGGNRSKAAKALGMSRTSFYRRLKDLGLE